MRLWHSRIVNFFQTVTIISLLIAGAVTAGPTGKISGKVTDVSTGEPLVGANVMIAGTVFGASTDEVGDNFINNIPPGSYEVSVA